jgi:uncharacterized protein YqjF (DUF2071 family)
VTVASYLAKLPAPQRREVERVRDVIRKNLPDGYEETLTSGMIVYEVPLAVYSDTYNGHALWYVALAARASGISLYLMNAYGSPELTARLRAGFEAAGKKLDMGKSCVRFKTADALALDTIGDIVASTPLEKYVAVAKAARRPQGKRKAG